MELAVPRTHSEEFRAQLAARNSLKKSKGRSGLRALFRAYVARANGRGLGFDLTIVEFEGLTTLPCHYCGTEPSQEKFITNKSGQRVEGSTHRYNGVDRVDNELGYTLPNCVPCCKTCNFAKRDMSVEAFGNWLKKAYNYSVGA